MRTPKEIDFSKIQQAIYESEFIELSLTKVAQKLGYRNYDGLWKLLKRRNLEIVRGNSGHWIIQKK